MLRIRSQVCLARLVQFMDFNIGVGGRGTSNIDFESFKLSSIFKYLSKLDLEIDALSLDQLARILCLSVRSVSRCSLNFVSDLLKGIQLNVTV